MNCRLASIYIYFSSYPKCHHVFSLELMHFMNIERCLATVNSQQSHKKWGGKNGTNPKERNMNDERYTKKKTYCTQINKQLMANSHYFPPSKKSFLSCASIRPLLRLLKSWAGNKSKSKSENAFPLVHTPIPISLLWLNYKFSMQNVCRNRITSGPTELMLDKRLQDYTF